MPSPMPGGQANETEHRPPGLPNAEREMVDASEALRDAREALRGFEGSILASVAESLARTAESLSETASRLERTGGGEWMSPEQARAYLALTPKQWERLAPSLPRRYLSERVVRYPKGAIDAALESAHTPEAAVADYRHAGKLHASRREKADSGGARSLKRAMERD